MDVVFVVVGHLVVDDADEVLDVKAPRRDRGGHEHGGVAW